MFGHHASRWLTLHFLRECPRRCDFVEQVEEDEARSTKECLDSGGHPVQSVRGIPLTAAARPSNDEMWCWNVERLTIGEGQLEVEGLRLEVEALVLKEHPQIFWWVAMSSTDHPPSFPDAALALWEELVGLQQVRLLAPAEVVRAETHCRNGTGRNPRRLGLIEELELVAQEEVLAACPLKALPLEGVERQAVEEGRLSVQ